MNKVNYFGEKKNFRQRVHPDGYHVNNNQLYPSQENQSLYGGSSENYGVHPGMFADPDVQRNPAGGGIGHSPQYGYSDEGAALAALGLDVNDFEEPDLYAREFQAIDWCEIRHNIIRVAVEIQGDWLKAGSNTLMKEGNPKVWDMLVAFWRDGVGMSQKQAEAVAKMSAADHPKKAFWSAAFISWCVRMAMPTPPPPHNGGFRFHMRHMAYIADCLRNRENNDSSRPFWLFDINDPNIVPEHGDILCLNRGTTRHSYQSVRQDWYVNNPTAVATGSSHCDIVIGHEQDKTRTWIETIGGNVSDTVGSRYYNVDANGRLVDQVQLNGSVISGKENVTQAVGSRPPVVFALIRLSACASLA